MYTHWMKRGNENARTPQEQTRAAMKKYYDRRATPQPDIEISDLVMLNGKKSKEQTTDKEVHPTIVRPV